jgi:hypothetical protein
MEHLNAEMDVNRSLEITGEISTLSAKESLD